MVEKHVGFILQVWWCFKMALILLDTAFHLEGRKLDILKVYFLLLNLQWPQKYYWTLKEHLKCMNMSLHYIHNSKSSSFCFQEIQHKYSFQARLMTFFSYKHTQYIYNEVKKYLDTLCLYFWAIVSKIPWFSKHSLTISTQAYTLFSNAIVCFNLLVPLTKHFISGLLLYIKQPT